MKLRSKRSLPTSVLTDVRVSKTVDRIPNAQLLQVENKVIRIELQIGLPQTHRSSRVDCGESVLLNEHVVFRRTEILVERDENPLSFGECSRSAGKAQRVDKRNLERVPWQRETVLVVQLEIDCLSPKRGLQELMGDKAFCLVRGKRHQVELDGPVSQGRIGYDLWVAAQRVAAHQSFGT